METFEKNIKTPVSGPGPCHPIHLMVEVHKIGNALQIIKNKSNPDLKKLIDNELFILSDCVKDLQEMILDYSKNL